MPCWLNVGTNTSSPYVGTDHQMTALWNDPTCGCHRDLPERARLHDGACLVVALAASWSPAGSLPG
eukprot:6001292-Lingulodinium_polyedra.AAC.1